MKKIILIILSCGFIAAGFTQTISKRDNIKKLLELTGSGKMGIQAAQAMLANFKKNYTAAPDEFWEGVANELNADTLVGMIIPIYDKHFSEEEIKQLTDFYGTPLGKKLIATLPVIMSESMEVGQIWGKEIGEKVYQKLKTNGYIKE